MEHVDIIDSERHEPKGASTAIKGYLLRSNGDGTTSFSPLSYNDLLNKPNILPPAIPVNSLSTSADTQTAVLKINELLLALRTAGIIGS